MRVLIATVTAGGGHLAAAAALEEAWRALRPGDVVEQLDLVKFFSPLHRKIHADGYLKLVEHAPELWGMLFKETDNPKRARRLKQFKPDAVLCTHYLPLEVLSELKRKSGFKRTASGARVPPVIEGVSPSKLGNRTEGETSQ